MNYNITKHAQIRMAQRGVRRDDLEVLLAHADLESDVGGQCTMLGLRRDTAQRLGVDDWMKRTAVIVSADGAIITVMPLYGSSAGRHYRRDRV